MEGLDHYTNKHVEENEAHNHEGDEKNKHPFIVVPHRLRGEEQKREETSDFLVHFQIHTFRFFAVFLTV